MVLFSPSLVEGSVPARGVAQRRRPPNSLILHAHAGSVPAIAGKLNLVSDHLRAIWAAIFTTLLRRTVASRVCALVLRFRLALFGGFFGDHCRTLLRTGVVVLLPSSAPWKDGR